MHRVKWESEKDPNNGFDNAEERDNDFVARREEFWSRVFDFTKLGGVDAPAVVRSDRAPKKKQFSFYMETDGVGCSCVCWKPKGPPGKTSCAGLSYNLPTLKSTTLKGLF